MNIEPIQGEPSRYYVQSRSHKDIIHIVDIEDQECSCEGWQFRKSCSHVKTVNEVINYLKQQEQEMMT